MRVRFVCCLGAVLSLATGCSDYAVRGYSLVVKNVSTKPITVGLAKNGPPADVEWESPADRAIIDAKNTGIGWGQVVPPGGTASVDNQRGRFAPGTSAFLRIYTGALSLNEILAIGPDSRLRTDIRLREGKTTLIVSDRGPFTDVFISEYLPAGEDAARTPPIKVAP